MVNYQSIVWAVAGAAVFTYGYIEHGKGARSSSTEGLDARTDAARRAGYRTEGLFSMAVGALFVLCAVVS